jgi:hypothetical protein
LEDTNLQRGAFAREPCAGIEQAERQRMARGGKKSSIGGLMNPRKWTVEVWI